MSKISSHYFLGFTKKELIALHANIESNIEDLEHSIDECKEGADKDCFINECNRLKVIRSKIDNALCVAE